MKKHAILLITLFAISSCCNKRQELDSLQFSREFLRDIHSSSLGDLKNIFIDTEISISEIEDGLHASGLFGYIVNAAPGSLQDIAWPRVDFVRRDGDADIMAVPLLSSSEYLLYFAVIRVDGKWRISR